MHRYPQYPFSLNGSCSLDFNASTPFPPEVAEAINSFLSRIPCTNVSSLTFYFLNEKCVLIFSYAYK